MDPLEQLAQQPRGTRGGARGSSKSSLQSNRVPDPQLPPRSSSALRIVHQPYVWTHWCPSCQGMRKTAFHT